MKLIEFSVLREDRRTLRLEGWGLNEIFVTQTFMQDVRKYVGVNSKIQILPPLIK
jgi:hypothetical protein